jgi:F-type H+-transporting ATPase subunit c
MKQKLMTLGVGMLVMASPMFAQDAAAGGGGALSTKAAALIAVGVAAGLCGLGQGRAVASAAEGMARNPGAIAAIRVSLLLGLAFMESLTLFTLMASKII